MQTRLNYSITYHENEHLEPTSSIKWRTYEFYVSKAKTPRIHEFIIQSFSSFLQKHDVENHIFGSSTWKECASYNNTSDYLFISIPVKNATHKDMIYSLYKSWKEENTIFLKPQTASTLRKLGWYGCQLNHTTQKVSKSIYPLIFIAALLMYEPYNVTTIISSANKTVAIYPKTQPPHLADNVSIFIVRNMAVVEEGEAVQYHPQIDIDTSKREIK